MRVNTVIQEDLNTWRKKPCMKNSHTDYRKNVDKESSLLWLSAGYIYPKMEGFAVATQDRVIKTRNYEKQEAQLRRRTD
jgi:TPP-dependent 2-oxoacid decarboxylase